VFGTIVLVFLIDIAVSIVVGVVLVALPTAVANGISSLVTGVLVGPYVAVVLTLGYFRLLAAHTGQTGQPRSSPIG
jgi:high-affinity Fe2+/Pb2+ permease